MAEGDRGLTEMRIWRLWVCVCLGLVGLHVVFAWTLRDELAVSRMVLETADQTQTATRKSIDRLSGELDQLAVQIDTGLKQVDRDAFGRDQQVLLHFDKVAEQFHDLFYGYDEGKRFEALMKRMQQMEERLAKEPLPHERVIPREP